jgi:uncharacterized protein YceK
MRKVISLILVLIFLSGCASTESIKRDKLNSLSLNMTTEQTKAMLGQPYATETYMTKDNKTALILNYIVRFRVRKIYPLVFVDNKLVGWGEDYYDALTGKQKVETTINVKRQFPFN